MDTSSFPVPAISPQAFNTRMGRTDSSLLLDVRREPAFRASRELLASARWCEPEDALALIVRGADTGALHIAPQSAGLLALSLGLSRLHAMDDHALLAAALPVYDALYAWCRQGQAERHVWNPAAITRAVQ